MVVKIIGWAGIYLDLPQSVEEYL